MSNFSNVSENIGKSSHKNHTLTGSRIVRGLNGKVKNER